MAENQLINFNGKNLENLGIATSPTNAQLMNLGNINANKITFDGDRVVLDTDRITGINNTTPQLSINSTTNDVILGKTDGNTNPINISINNSTNIDDYSYQWIKDSTDLTKIGDNSSQKYALRNSIDMTDTTAYSPINNFSGKLDGLDYNIFGLTINNNDENTGLFANTNGATLSNLNLISGSITGTNNVGSLIGTAKDTNINNVINTLSVKGANKTGGIVGSADNTKFNNVINTGTITATSDNTGGIAGSINNSNIIGETYNLGKVSSTGANVGGIAGTATNSTIGNADINSFQIYNHMNVTGAYNVGGIAGSIDKSTVQNIFNEGNIKATSFIENNYIYHTDNPNVSNNIDNDGNRLDTKKIAVANTGGIVGVSNNSTIKHIRNQGNVNSNKQDKHDYYDAGNIGGIVGKATNTDITHAENKENNIYGANNVGGIAGYLETGTITNATNNGGDIMATGARTSTNNFATEKIRVDGSDDDTFIIGNMGGIVGYMYGNDTFINSSSNRGTVHSLAIQDENNISDSSKAANVGGIVGKVDRKFSTYVQKNNLEDYLTEVKKDSFKKAINNSYNTGDVQGYSGIGGIAGFMYNGEITNSYNMGEIRTTRISAGKGGANMGGILGDTMERSPSRAILYNVYNKGQIGDKDFKYYGRHVGGVVGRFAGIIDTAYNSGDIYNGAAVTGGLAGYWNAGTIKNVFNTGNITVLNHSINTEDTTLGGVVGSARGYTQYLNGTPISPADNSYTIKVLPDTYLNLNNAYNLGTLRAFADSSAGSNTMAGIIGEVQNLSYNIYPAYNVNVSNVYSTGNLFAGRKTGNLYTPTSSDQVYAILNNPKPAESWENPAVVKNISNAYYINPTDNKFTTLTGAKLNGATAIDFKDSISNHDNNSVGSFSNFSTDDWRFYNGTTPILNAFMPKLGEGDNFNKATGLDKSLAQFGTAYNPLLTIIKDNDVSIDKAQNYLNLSDSIAVYNGNLAVKSDSSPNSTNLMYSGTLYSDNDLIIDNNANFGKASNLYGSSITINDDNDDVLINGTITATDGNVTINGKNITAYGNIKSAKNGETTSIDGIAQSASDLDFSNIDINDINATMPNIGSQYNTIKTATKSGDITIKAKENINALYGNMKAGSLSSGNDLKLTAQGKIYVDSDLNVGNELTASGAKENIIDITNTQNQNDLLSKSIKFNGENSKLTVDLWDYDNNKFKDPTDLQEALNNSNVKPDKIYTWISNADQLNAIDSFKDNNSKGLKNNFALKNDIDASNLNQYNTINNFTGNFDGRDNRILDLTSSKGIFDTNEGTIRNLKVYSSTFNGGAIANTNTGTIQNITTLGNLGNTVNVNDKKMAGGIVADNTGTISDISDRGTIKGTAGATIGGIAGINSGTIKNSITNSDVAGDKATSSSISGGIAGKNTGNISDVESLGITKGYSAGGIVGNSSAGEIKQVYNESLVSGTTNIGGIAGINQKDSSITDAVNATKIEATDDNVGGLIGDNYGAVTNGRNNGEINGKDNVGGLVGVNNGSMLNTLNNDASAKINGTENVGGIAGINKQDGVIDINKQDLINRGSITGTTNVGGITGNNEGTINGDGLTNEIELYITNGAKDAKNFGGVAGINSGKINGATNSGKLTVNNATNVGGIVGENSGSLTGNIENTGSVDGTNSNSVGGIIGKNNKDFTEVTMKNGGNVIGNNDVGGIIGENTGTISKSSMINTTDGAVNGNDSVGGIIGKNAGSITGGRDDKGNYYKYQIYNNGAVAGSNQIGGLIGNNIGSLTAGYNTGSVNGSNDIGGIVGSNNGNIDQVFNTLADGQQINGDTNIGGLIGTNEAQGTISNAYNSTSVNGKTNIGTAVGNNIGTMKNIYGSDNIVGAGNGKRENVYTINKDNATDKDTYKNFDDTTIWRFQDGNTSPLLKVFLTKVQVNKDTNVDWNNLIYNGKLQGFVAKAKNNIVYIYRANADGSATNEKVGSISALDDTGAHSLADYLNTGKDNPNSDLISSSLNKNAGEYELFYSHQINTKGQDNNPNNLGYDFTSSTTTTPPKYTINKKKLNIQLTDVKRDYGNTNIKDGKYDFVVDGWIAGENFNDKLSLDKTSITDTALSKNTNRNTNDVGKYTWQGKISVIDDLQNYELEKSIQYGESIVEKVNLIISADDKTINKGEKPIYTGKYTGLVNGDTWNDIKGGNFDITDDKLEGQIGTHSNQIGIWLDGKFYTQDSSIFKNYDVHIKPGTLIVKNDNTTPPVDPDKPPIDPDKPPINPDKPPVDPDKPPIDPDKPPVDPDKPNININKNFYHDYEDDDWGRKRHFRERRAEFNYIAGGTNIDDEEQNTSSTSKE